MPDCEEIKAKVEDLIRKMGYEDRLEVYTAKFGEKLCAVDIGVKSPFMKISVFETIKDFLQAIGYRVSAVDVFSRCHKPDEPLQLRMNVYKE